MEFEKADVKRRGWEGNGFGGVLDVLAAYRVERGRSCCVWVLLAVRGGEKGVWWIGFSGCRLQKGNEMKR